MGLSETAAAHPSRKGGLPRWLVVCLSVVVLFVGIPLVDFGVPWLLSLLGTRYGWTTDGPGPWNLIGLAPVAVGESGVLWFAFTAMRHLHLLPERVKLGLTPQILITTGPFAFSRNPRYLFAGTLWLGLAIFLGSIPILVVLAGGVLLGNYVVMREERTLGRQFGEVYLRYRSTVPRWLGKIRPDILQGPTPGFSLCTKLAGSVRRRYLRFVRLAAAFAVSCFTRSFTIRSIKS